MESIAYSILNNKLMGDCIQLDLLTKNIQIYITEIAVL